MRVLFCSNPIDAGAPDPAFGDEAEAARQIGLPVGLVSFEALVTGSNPAAAVRRVAPAEGAPETAVYRGWMLRTEQYAALYARLEERGLSLVSSPEQYRRCHYLPGWYEELREHTPRTVWVEGEAEALVAGGLDALAELGGGSAVVKDWVKSQKHYWDEACFIPDVSDRPAAERVIRRFLELQGEDPVGGVVLREFVPFERGAAGSRARELRLWYLDGTLLYCSPQEEGDDRAPELPLDRFHRWADRIRSRFFTMDVARRENGDWMVVELGDGQVAGIPEAANTLEFYRRLSTALQAAA